MRRVGPTIAWLAGKPRAAAVAHAQSTVDWVYSVVEGRVITADDDGASRAIDDPHDAGRERQRGGGLSSITGRVVDQH